jgi:hypothetical protein
MKYRFSRLLSGLLAVTLLLAIAGTEVSCSQKSGCPADDVHPKTDENGIPKAGKTKSGLLPPKAYKKSKKR